MELCDFCERDNRCCEKSDVYLAGEFLCGIEFSEKDRIKRCADFSVVFARGCVFLLRGLAAFCAVLAMGYCNHFSLLFCGGVSGFGMLASFLEHRHHRADQYRQLKSKIEIHEKTAQELEETL